MKFLTYILLALLAAGCQASVPLKWTVESSHAEPVYFNVYRGETLELEATFNSYGRPLTNGLNAAQIFWQTNGMESAWWYDDATVEGNRIRATFTPEMYPDATTVRVFLGVTNSIYRADATLRIRHSPANPNHLYPPIPVLDFDQVEVHNAPWQRPLTAGDNIVITNDVISALGGGGGGVTPDDLAAVAEAATNYTDAAVADLPTADDLAAVAEAATNYVDNYAVKFIDNNISTREGGKVISRGVGGNWVNAVYYGAGYIDVVNATGGVVRIWLDIFDGTNEDYIATREWVADNFSGGVTPAEVNEIINTNAVVASKTTTDDVREIIAEEGSVKTNAAGVATFANVYPHSTNTITTAIDSKGVEIEYEGNVIGLDNYGVHYENDDGGLSLDLASGGLFVQTDVDEGVTNKYALYLPWLTNNETFATREWTDEKISGNYLPINKVASGATTNLFIRFGSRDSSAFANVGSYSATFGQGHIAKGARAFAANADNLAYGNDSAAFGGKNVTTNTYAFVVGESNNAGGRASFVAGGRAKTEQAHAYAFAWNGDTNVLYTSKAKGTFNVNPIGGTAGFYIGSTNLATLLSQSSGVTESRVHELITNDVPSWARQTSKPTYTYSEIGGTFPGMTDVSCTMRGISAIKNTSNNRLEISKAPIETIVTTNTAFAFYDGMSVRKFTGSVLNVDTTIANWPDGESCFVILDLPTTAVTAPTKLHVIGSDNVLTGRMQTAMWRVGNDFYLNIISRAGANDYLVTDKELGR